MAGRLVAERGFTKNKPTGFMKWFYGAPKWMFKARLGFLFGKRFCMVEHVGRKSGTPFETPLEVVVHDGDRYVIASGWGDKADWYLNLKANPATGMWVGTRRYGVTTEILTVQQGIVELASYKKLHPRTAKSLWKGMGLEPDAPDLEVAETIPTVALTLQR